MTQLSDMPDIEDPQHLLLIADSKVGKSTYVAQAAIDGFPVIYIDSDNGRSALRKALEGELGASKRVTYFGVSKPVAFMKGFLRSTTAKPFVWNATRQMEYAKANLTKDPTDKLQIIDATAIPFGAIVSIDSWSSLASDALGIGDVRGNAALLSGTDQSIYGDANANLTFIANLIQKVPYHVIAQAHATVYERYEKPTGTLGKDMKQAVMVLRESLDVPISSSRPHAQVMVSRFNQIAWMFIDNLGTVKIDFTRKANRLGGGTPNAVFSLKAFPFSKLCSPSPEPFDPSVGFLREMTLGEWEAK